MTRKQVGLDALAATVEAPELDDATVPVGSAGDTATAGHPVNAAPSSLTSSGAVRPTARIGRYAILRQLGEGGMGVVLVGYDESLDRKAAVKVLHRGVAAEQWLVREAQALAKLSHPNVVPVFEVGQHEGRVFLAMEYVDGTTLREHIEGGERPVDEVLRMFVQAGRGLAAAHQAGLVHRDFKPDNVLVGRDGRARVADFGIASLADGVGSGEPAAGAQVERPSGASPSAFVSPLTQTGALLGTPAFMSQEQFRGEQATPASDQFSFCVALYKAAYDQAPFEGETLFELAAGVCAGKLRPPPPAPSVPPWLRDVLRRGLSLSPEARYPTLAALLDEIETRLPRDDEDPSYVRREQTILFGVLFAYSAAITGFVAWRGPAAYGPLAPLGTGVVFLLASLIAVGLVWKGLRRNAFGRRLGALVLGVAVTVIAHRLVELGLGTPAYHVMVIDCFLLVLAFALATLLIDRRFWPVMVTGAASVLLATLFPLRSPVIFGVYGLIGLGTGVILWGRSS